MIRKDIAHNEEVREYAWALTIIHYDIITMFNNNVILLKFEVIRYSGLHVCVHVCGV